MCFTTLYSQSISATHKPNRPLMGSCPLQKTELLPIPPLKMFPSPCVQQSLCASFPLPSEESLPLNPTLPQLIICPSSHFGGKPPATRSLVFVWFVLFFPGIRCKYSIRYWHFTLTSQWTGLAIDSESSWYKPVTKDHCVTLVKY